MTPIHRISVISLLALATSLCAPAFASLDEAQALINQGNYSRALSVIDSHLSAQPQDAEARFTRGLVLVKLNRVDDALKTFANLTRDYPQLPEPYNNLAVLYAQQGDYEKARDALEAALATHPSYATAHENLGDIYAALASAAYNRALLLDQANDAVRSKLQLMEQMNTLPIDNGNVAASTYTPPAAVQQPRPVTSPVATVQAASPAEAEAVSGAVYDWAQAWSSQNVGAYLASYDATFIPADGLSRGDWEAQRRSRIARPGAISVRVRDPQIDMLGDDRARVTFRQDYSSATYSDAVTKVLDLRRRDGNTWKITSERSR